MKIQRTEEELAKIKAAGNGGKLSDKAKKVVEKKFAASEEAFKPLVKRLQESRRFSEQELSFRVNTTR